MQFLTLLSLPLFLCGVLAAPSSSLSLIERGDFVVGQTGAADNFCVFKMCLNQSKTAGGPKCNVDQCLASQAGNVLMCGIAAIDPKIANKLYCASGIVNLSFNMVSFPLSILPFQPMLPGRSNN
ncbi:hypothetical protein EG328_006441 [Venturia inaequalis]|uniref:Uncharacterized protein n=1 Tax=Venturia inaequalis TaxID=5025 RepID=A0A8H3UIB4_VENIN|nr:hypothetical protein EG328_006441 [Venturia inaequalis]